MLNQKCGPLYRVASLLRACSDKPFTERDSQTLKLHGMGEYAMGGNSSLWLRRYAAETLRFVEFERQALPCALVRQSAHANTSKDKKSKVKKSKVNNGTNDDPRPLLSFTAADMEARSVMEQRLQSLVCCFSMVSKFLSLQTQFQSSEQQSASPPPPMSVLPVLEAIDAVWKILQPIPRLMDKHMVQLLYFDKSKPKPKPKVQKKKMKAVNKELKETPTDVHDEIEICNAIPASNGNAGCNPSPLEEPDNNKLGVAPATFLLNPNGNGMDCIRFELSENSPLDNLSAPPVFATQSTTPPLPPLTNVVPVERISPPKTMDLDPTVSRVVNAISDVKNVLKKENKPNSLSELRDRIQHIQSIISELCDLASPTAK